MARFKRFKYDRLPRISPLEKAQEMLGLYGPEKACAMAGGLAKSSYALLAGGGDPRELNRTHGLWQSVHGYLRKIVDREVKK